MSRDCSLSPFTRKFLKLLNGSSSMRPHLVCIQNGKLCQYAQHFVDYSQLSRGPTIVRCGCGNVLWTVHLVNRPTKWRVCVYWSCKALSMKDRPCFRCVFLFNKIFLFFPLSLLLLLAFVYSFVWFIENVHSSACKMLSDSFLGVPGWCEL